MKDHDKIIALKNLADAADTPAFIVGEDKRIIYKNEAAALSHIKIRTGAHIKNYISATDIEKIFGSEINGPVPVSIKSDNIYNCIVRKAGNGFIVKILNLSALLLYRISRFSDYTQNKILKYSTIANALMNSGEKAIILPEISKKLLCIVKFQSRMTDYIRLCEASHKSETEARPAFASAKEAIDAINACLTGHHISIKADEIAGSYGGAYIDINRTDFYMLITYLISFSVRYLRERDPVLRLSKFETNIIFSVEGETVLSEDEADAVCVFDPDGVFPAGCEDLMFSVMLSKALAEHCGWRFDITVSGIGYSRLKAFIAVPVSDGVPPLTLRSPEIFAPLISIVKTEFADIDQ
ncbi:MAG: hypothetical protein IJS94_03715 [Clostridia bacterium]|nr:hypothetical protein [Clostridia bacterium]